MNPLAQELNEVIRKENPHVLEMLSTLGKELFFPRGIIAQTTEAKAKARKFNATIGMAREAGHAMYLSCVMDTLSALKPDEALNYAPVAGIPELRAAWREKILRGSPSLTAGKKPVSLPVVTNGLTHGLSIVADLFCDPGDALLAPDQIWGNYRLNFCTRRGARIVSYPFYGSDGALNVAGFRETLKNVASENPKVIVLLNFPNNPTGYAPTKAEAEQIASALGSTAEAGTNIVALTDDAYFGLFYEPDVMRESLFALIAGAHERLLAVKGDAATKEVFVWGLRVGFLSFSVCGCEEGSPIYAAIEKKVSGAVRSVISNCSMLSQRVVLRALRSPNFDSERKAKRDLLCERAQEVKRVLAQEKYADTWKPYAFNSGYFMCLRLRSVAAEALRKHLLEKYGVGTIATGEHDLRVAFSCVEKKHISTLFDTIFLAAGELA